MKATFLKTLKERNLIKEITPYTEYQMDDAEEFSGYIGFDPTAASLHVGNLCAIMLLKFLQLSGHKPIILLGGFTGHIGDPAGKANERKLLSDETVADNLKGLRAQFSKFLDFEGPNAAEIVNNADWLGELSLSSFLREVGKHITISYMIAKDSVKTRMENGLSFTEFTYQLFQAYDFYWLSQNKNCKLQMGGSDQWGNITGGAELTRRKIGKELYALTTPLLLKSDNTKFGKSEEGNIWLDPQMTSPYKFYQFWLNVEDAQVGQLLRTFTILDTETIAALEAEFADKPTELKKILARELTITVHSAEVFEQVERASKLLYSQQVVADLEATEEALIGEITQGLSQKQFLKRQYFEEGVLETISQVYGVSKTEARRLIKANGISINKQKVSETAFNTEFTLIKGKYLLLQKGKTYGLATFSE